ncbi:MAG TPA: hypothetical protein VFX30_01570 [bacterium]|nr:hypothetical protein [bacterium]
MFAKALRATIEEIRNDPVLRIYGFCLAVTHILTFLFWRGGYDLVSLLTAPEPMCWPFWADCFRYRFLSPDGVYWLLRGYLFLSLIAGGLFTRKKWVAAAWWMFLAVNLLKLAVVLQDFQLRLNQHYMAGLACLAFLFVPGKRRFLKILIAFFYFWAGVLKLDPEWLSGAALYRPVWFFTGRWLPVICTYVVVLEIVFVWGLFSRRRWIFWTTLAQLLVFHVFSWPVVGYFYPTLMFCLLTIYPMDFVRPAAGTEPKRFGRLGYAFLGVFSLAQLVPYAMPGDSALTGEGRIFGVHMFDALVQCEAYALLKETAGTERKLNLHRNWAARIHCDPVVYWNRARALCRSEGRGTVFKDFDLILNARRSTETELKPVLAVENFCATDPAYRVWRHNEWIRTD